jgi:hypothetical protein
MGEVIKLIAEIVNMSHDILMHFTEALGLQLTDKDLHLWVIGVMGFLIFVFVQVLFKLIAQWSITAISFIYTFTVLIVIVFAIEIQQKITGRGNMEFADAVIGLYGFLLFFGAYLVITLAIKFIIKAINNKKKSNRKSRTN